MDAPVFTIWEYLPVLDDEGNITLDVDGNVVLATDSTPTLLEWITPKTDWYGAVDSEGNYQGDRFNVEDYMRIRNNLLYLREASKEYYATADYKDMLTKTVRDYLYADEFNAFEDNLEALIDNTVGLDYGKKILYRANAQAFDYNELNRIESAMLSLFDRIIMDKKFTRTLTFTLGEVNPWQ